MSLFKVSYIGIKLLIWGAAISQLTVVSAGMLLAGPKGAAGDLYIANRGSIIQVDSVSGAVVGVFADYEMGVVTDARFGPDGYLYVADDSLYEVNRYNGMTGDFVDTFIHFSVVSPFGIRFESNGNLLVDTEANIIMEYDANGQYLGYFADSISSFWDTLDIGPDGNIYDVKSDSIVRFAPDGTPLGTFASGGGLSRPQAHVFGPNGNLFVVSQDTDSVIEFDGTTGTPIGTFINAHLSVPIGIAFGPDGNVWVSNFDSNDINEFDGTTGAWIRQVTGFFTPTSITVKPGFESDCLMMTVSSLTKGVNTIWSVSGATPGARVTVVYGFQAGNTIIRNQAGYCATFGIKGVNLKKLVGSAISDSLGMAIIVRTIPGTMGGLTILTQASERGTCPDECVSRVDAQVVQ